QYGVRRLEFSLGGLIRIGCRADSNVLSPDLLVFEVACHQCAGIALDVNLPLEIATIELHIFVRISRITIVAAEFAAAVRVHRPGKGHARRIATVQNRPNGQQKVLRASLGLRQRGGSGEACDTDQILYGLQTPVGVRRGRRSAASLTNAVGGGWEKGEAGRSRAAQTVPCRRRSGSKRGKSSHRYRTPR